jgi:hypothetical protein
VLCEHCASLQVLSRVHAIFYAAAYQEAMSQTISQKLHHFLLIDDPGYPIALKDVPPDVMAQDVAEAVQHGRGAATMIAAVLSEHNLFE